MLFIFIWCYLRNLRLKNSRLDFELERNGRVSYKKEK